MGTTWNVTYIDGDHTPSEEEIRQGIEDILEQVDGRMSTYRPNSELTLLNEAPLNTWVELSFELTDLLLIARRISVQTDGAYDVTVGPLVNLWGFGPDHSSDEVPGPDEIAGAMAMVGQGVLQIDAEQHKLRKPRLTYIDLSSIAKGYGVDQVANWLVARDIDNYLVEIGGDMRVAGLSPRGVAWRIAVEQPEPGEREVAVALHLVDAAIATSGDYRNFFERDGVRYSHTIDPRTGHPVTHDLVSVTVVHPRAAEADAWATALTVLGAKEALAMARDLNLATYLISREGEGYTVQYTEAFGAYLE